MAAAQWQVASLLCVAWSLTLLYGEWLQYAIHAPLCRDLLPNRTEARRMDRSQMSSHFTVAVLATPQLVVSSSRALLPHQIRSDLQLRRRFRASILGRAAPNEVVVLGDLFSGTLPLKGKEWETSLSRYKHIFDPVIRRHQGPHRSRSLRNRKRRPIPRVVQIPGPVDVGRSRDSLGADDEYFDDFSHAFSLDLNFYESVDGAFNLFGLNSPAADGNKSSHHTRTFWSFVEQAQSHVQGDSSDTQNVVLTPLPISSPLGASCFSLRHSYWVNTRTHAELTKNSTAKLVSKLRPTFFISGGHEGETCWQAMQAPSSSSGAQGKAAAAAAGAEGKDKDKGALGALQGGQIMLGSFNPELSHASAPFLLLSAPPPPPPPMLKGNSTKKSLAYPEVDPSSRLHMQLCVTPSQFGLVAWYYLLALGSLAALLLTPAKGPTPFEELQRGFDDFRSQFKSVKLKTENGEAAYVEVLDAEGNLVTMPLIEVHDASMGSAATHRGTMQREVGPQHRGKSHTQQRLADLEQGTNRDRNKLEGGVSGNDSLSPQAGFLPTLGVLRSRLFGAAGPLVVLLGVELALYLSMLASDWA